MSDPSDSLHNYLVVGGPKLPYGAPARLLTNAAIVLITSRAQTSTAASPTISRRLSSAGSPSTPQPRLSSTTCQPSSISCVASSAARSVSELTSLAQFKRYVPLSQQLDPDEKSQLTIVRAGSRYQAPPVPPDAQFNNTECTTEYALGKLMRPKPIPSVLDFKAYMKTCWTTTGLLHGLTEVRTLEFDPSLSSSAAATACPKV
jgi:hypothetical protein